MTGPAPAKTSSSRRLFAAAIGAVAAAITIACGTDFYEIPIETPIQAKLDVSAFQRVLVAGFVAGGTDDVDANQETVRLLRSQLRTKSSLKVIDADIMPLIACSTGSKPGIGAIGPCSPKPLTDIVTMSGLTVARLA